MQFVLREVRLQETQLRQEEIPFAPATTTTTAPVTTSASTSVRTTTTSNPTLDVQTSATDVPLHDTTAQSGGIRRPMEADSEMGTGVGDVDTDVPMLVIDQQLTVEGRREFTDGSDLDSKLPTHVLCPRRWNSMKKSRQRT